MATKKKAKKS